MDAKNKSLLFLIPKNLKTENQLAKHLQDANDAERQHRKDEFSRWVARDREFSPEFLAAFRAWRNSQ